MYKKTKGYAAGGKRKGMVKGGDRDWETFYSPNLL
jgi:hypothetical protein